jgi:hypothetical protein
MQLDPERTCNLQDGRDARVTVSTQCTVQAFAPQAGRLRTLRHPLGLSNITKSSGDTGCVIRCLVKPGIKVAERQTPRNGLLSLLVCDDQLVKPFEAN